MEKDATYWQYLAHIQHDVQACAQKNNHGRNYIRLFRPYNAHKMNIQGTFADAVEKEGCARPHFDARSACSLGMIAAAQFETYQAMVTAEASPLAGPDAFEAYLDAHLTDFCLDPEECRRAGGGAPETWKKALLARCVLAACRSGGFTLRFSQEADKQAVMQALGGSCCSIEQDPENALLLRLSGRPSALDLAALEGFSICEGANGGIAVGARTAGEDAFPALYTPKYAHAYTHPGGALYSGVIPRLLHVEYQKPGMSNTGIEKLLLHTGRTSYLTMYGMARTDVLRHPFLQEITAEGETLAGWNVRFDQNEVQAQNVYLQTLRAQDARYAACPAGKEGEAFEQELAALNAYLDTSWNVHNINISGNLITSDDYCLYTRRAGNIEDAGNFYCSVNGGGEIDDDSVSFYETSVEEDVPTICYGEKPYYFGREMTREAIAELGTIDISNVWKYYGLTAMGHITDENDAHRIWLHFNVLGERRCTDTFDFIREQKAQAAESFESSSLFGYQLNLFATKRALAGYRMHRMLDWIIDQKDTLTLIAVFAVSMILNETFLDLDNILSLIFVGIMAIVYLYQWHLWRKERKSRRTINCLACKANIPYHWYTALFAPAEKTHLDAVFLYLSVLRLEQIFH